MRTSAKFGTSLKSRRRSLTRKMGLSIKRANVTASMQMCRL